MERVLARSIIGRILGPFHNWVIVWADRPYGALALFLLAFSESISFPVPPDVLLILLALARPARAFGYAAVCLAGSVLGGIGGYLLGLKFWAIAQPLLLVYMSNDKFELVRSYFVRYDAWAIAIAGFTPIPYKIFTISAGFFRIDFSTFLIASVLSRGARFFLVAGFLYFFGRAAKEFIERYFDLLTLGIVVLLALGFLILRFLF